MSKIPYSNRPICIFHLTISCILRGIKIKTDQIGFRKSGKEEINKSSLRRKNGGKNEFNKKV